MLRVYPLLPKNDKSMYRLPLGTSCFNEALETADIRLVTNPAHADVILADVRLVDAEQMLPKPYVLMELCGYGTLLSGPHVHKPDTVGYAPTDVRELIKLPDVKKYIKQAYYRKLEHHNQTLFELTVGGQLLYDKLSNFERPRLHQTFFRDNEPITQAEFDKLVPICNHPWHPASVHARRELRDIHLPKAIDVTIIGNGGCYTTWYTRQHRLMCIEAMRNLPPQIITCDGLSDVAAETRKNTWPSMHAHLQLLRMSRVGVSPWGYNEYAVRDVEVAASGCVLIKPVADLLVAWPDIYNHPATLSCAPDFSDLREKIEYALDNWSSLEVAAAERAEQLKQLFRTNTSLAHRYAEVLYEAADTTSTWSLRTMSGKRRKFERPKLSVGITAMPSHPARVAYLRETLRSFCEKLITPCDYELVVAMEPVEDRELLNEAIDICNEYNAVVVMHDKIRGYGPNTAFLVYSMTGHAKLITQDDTILPDTLDIGPYLELIDKDPKTGLVSLGWMNNEYAFDEPNTPREFRHLVTKVTHESKYLYSDGIHIRTPLLAEAVGIYHPGWERDDEWKFNVACKQAHEAGRFNVYASKINYRHHIGYWSIVQTDKPWHLSNYVLPIPSSSSSSDSSSKSQSSSEIASELK